MSSPEGISREIHEAENLRDRALQYLPANFAALSQPVMVSYFPLSEEHNRLNLVMEYNPSDESIGIDVSEVIGEDHEESDTTGEPDWDTYRQFIYHKSLELDIETGNVLAYSEWGDVRDQHDKIIVTPPADSLETPNASDVDMDEERAGRIKREGLVATIDKPVFDTFDQERMDYLLSLLDRL